MYVLRLSAYSFQHRQHHLRRVEKPKGEGTVAQPPAHHQVRSVSVHAPGVAGAQALAGREHRPHPRQDELPAVCMAGKLHVESIVLIRSRAPQSKGFGIMGKHQLDSLPCLQLGEQLGRAAGRRLLHAQGMKLPPA